MIILIKIIKMGIHQFVGGWLKRHYRTAFKNIKFLNIVLTKSFQFALDKIAEAFQKRAENLFKKT